MEHHVVLTTQEAYELSQKLEFTSIGFVKDDYTGEKRIRVDDSGLVREKEYVTPVKGTILRFSAKCRLGDIEDVWFEVRWTEDKVRFEVEFEGEVPEEYKNKENIHGWDILK